MSNPEQVFKARFELLYKHGLASQASISAALDTLNQVEQHTGIVLNEALGAPLATHLATMLKRLLHGEVLQPAPEVLWLELQSYPEQLQLARILAANLEKRLGIPIPEDESGFIAIHLARIALAVADSPETSPSPTPEEQ